MAKKQVINLNFSKGVDTKSDPKQIPIGSFEDMENSVFTKAGLLQKRNGYQAYPNLPNTSFNYITTFSGNLVAIDDSFSVYASGSDAWVDKGYIQPISLSTTPVVRSAANQSQVDSVLAPNNYLCTAYAENSATSTSYKYVVTDLVTGEHIIEAQVIQPTFGNIVGGLKVFLLGNQFIIVFGTQDVIYHLQYISINIYTPSVVTEAQDISTNYLASTYCAFDGIVANNILYLAYNGSDIGGAVRVASINTSLTVNEQIFNGIAATVISICVDTTQQNSIVYVSSFDFGAGTGNTFAVDHGLNIVFEPVGIITQGTVLNIISSADNQVCTVLYEVNNVYGYDATKETNYLNRVTVTQFGVVSPTTQRFIAGVGLASKTFQIGTNIYFAITYSSPAQPSYWISNQNGQIVARYGYQNGGGYITLGLPSVSTNGNIAYLPYLFADQIQPVNKSVNAPSYAGVYIQTGINLLELDFNSNPITTAEVGGNLNISGGMLWTYDGSYPVEQGFHLYPDDVEVTTEVSGGYLSAQIYNYQVIYSWIDNKGNTIQSAPSVPVAVTCTTSSSLNAIYVPTLRLSYKTNVQIQIYRWSAAQQNFFLVNSVDQPVLNDPTVDYITYVDTKADADILGNALLYTTGNVLEYIGAPACNIMTLFQNRLFIVDAEQPDLIWVSNTISPGVPVQFSDLLTIGVTPTISAGVNSGPITGLFSLDANLIVFKEDSIFYITGNGLTTTGVATGNFTGFSPPIFINSTVGCANQHSIALVDNGIMFQSDKGIWLLDRSLQTHYIGAPVEKYNSSVVNSSVTAPGTNQVRFTLNTGETLVYDYFYKEWNIFSNVAAISSTIYQNLHTYLNAEGQVFQEKEGSYIDGADPVLLDVTTGPISLAGIQGYQNLDSILILGQYYSPHKIIVEIYYDYENTPSQQSIISPLNYAPVYGGDLTYGATTPYGGPPALEQWKIFASRRKCMAFQIRIYEQFDPNFDVNPSQGFTLSAISLVVQTKKGYYPLNAQNQVG